jgi:hypothetical protein
VKKITLVLSTIAVAVLIGYCYLFRPYLAIKEVRISTNPEEIRAVYVNVTGNPLCAKLYRLERMEGDEPVASDDPIFLALPNSLPSPEDGNYAYSDNLFLLEGYRYQIEERNKLTGNKKTTPSNRFDVIAWEVIAPYKIWKKENSDNTTPIEVATANAPMKYRMKSSDHGPSKFIKGNYVDCLR